jgi:hypothetical protein
MYGLPDNFDPNVFVGRTLERLSFTTNTLRLSFDGDISIIVESEVRHEGRDGRGAEWVDSNAVPVTESRMMHLLGIVIARAEVAGRGTLVLEFTNGHTLRCVEDSDEYECYQLRIGATEIIV